MVLFTQAADGSYRAHNATVVGDVKIGEKASFWFNAVVRGDVAPITIGARTNVQDNAVLHCDGGVPLDIGEDVLIGHGAIVHGRRVGRGTMIGMGAIVLGRTEIGENCLVAAGAVVPPGLVVPDGMLVIGVPGKIARPVKAVERSETERLVGHYVRLAQEYCGGQSCSSVKS